MSLRGLFFIGLFGVCCLCAFANPFAGIVAYVVHYHSYPERSWWGQGLADLGVRYSYTISACLAAGTLLNLGRLPYGRLLVRQEWLYLAFLLWMILLRQLTGFQEATFRGGGTGVSDAVDKMTKMAVFLLALTHVVVTPVRFSKFFWLLASCGLYLGYEAYTAPGGMYHEGRLEGIGGPDFSDANALGAHALVLLPIVGVQFLGGRPAGKLLCVAAGGLLANTVVQTRSRAAFLGLALGVVASLALAPRAQRRKIRALVAVGALAAPVLVDDGFVERMWTLEASQREEDGAAQSRLEIWGGGLKMIADHPMGVGPSNFAAHIGTYLPHEAGRDTHNTYIRCAAELGLVGFAIFMMLIANAFATLRNIKRACAGRPGFEAHANHAFALQISLMMYMVCMIFGSFIYTEILWWVLLLPAALGRVVDNAATDPPPAEATTQP